MGAPAGWYDDPQNSQQIRYFDGTDWTSRTAPRPARPGPIGSPTTPPAYGSYGQPSSQGWQGQAGQFQQPQAVRQTPSYSFDGSQAIPTADAPSTGGRSVGLWIAAAFVGVVLLTVLGVVLSDDDPAAGGSPSTANGLSAFALGIEPDFDCNTLGDAYIELSVNDPLEEKLIAVNDLEVVENNIGTVTAPSGRSENLIYACNATAEWADGTTTKVRMELTLDSEKELYAGVYDR